MKNLFLGLFVLISACAHSSHQRGSVVMRDKENKVHVCLGEGQVKEGDGVTFYKSVCESLDVVGDKGSKRRVKCHKSEIGKGKVVDVMDEHYSTVEIFGSLLIPEGTIVEND